jgi:hypothetical protein
MNPPLFATLFASSAVKAIFGSSPLRIYAFGDAPAKGATGYAVPYAVFQTVFGSPENYLGNVPDLDAWRVQVDVYATDTGAGGNALTNARNGAKAIRDALEPVAYVVSFNLEGKDEATQLHRYSFDVSFQTSR